MKRLHRLRGPARELRGAIAFLLLAVIGWGLASDTLALFGCLGCLTVIALHLWQRHCLDGLAYRQRLEQSRAAFGDEVGLEVEILNDKPLPLSYLQIEEEVPAGLPIDGGTVAAGLGRQATLVQILPLLPYQRVRRRLVVHCLRRGDHRFGPCLLTSGDPVGRRVRSRTLPELQRLLVYPKLLALAPEGVASRLLLGDDAARRELVGDPARVAGVRTYQPGDPLRHVDWRATARCGELLVRRFEPTVRPRVAVFFDVRVPQFTSWAPDPDELEFAVSVTASLVLALAQADVPVGLYCTGTAGGRPVGHRPSGSPAALAPMLESLARLVPQGSLLLSSVLAAAGDTLPRQTSLVVVAGDFADPILLAIDELRRRHSVSALHLSTGSGRAPTPGRVDAMLQVRYEEGWHERTNLELTA